MTTYAETRCSRIPWVGKMPSHWHTAPLSSLVDENKAKNTGLIETNLLSLSYGKLIRKDINTVGGLLPASFEGYQVLKPGHIVLRMTDLQNDQRSLRSAISTEHGIITSAYIGLIPHVDVNSKFLKWVLFAYDIAKAFYAFGGGVRQSLTFNDLKKLPILLPSTEEQKSIVRYLDSETAEIDDLEAKLCEQRALLETYKRQVIAETVTRGLDPNVPLKDSGERWIGAIPQSWKVVPLRALLRRTSKKGRPDLRLLSVERERGVVDRLTDGSADNHNRVPDDLSDYKVVRNGQFVMNKMKAWQGSYGVSAADGIVSPAYYVFDLAVPVPSFFNWAIRSAAYIGYFGRDSYGIRTDQWDFKPNALKSIPFAMPPENEQREIVSFLEMRVSAINEVVADIDRQIGLLETYRKQLISDVVTGKIRVSEDAA